MRKLILFLEFIYEHIWECQNLINAKSSHAVYINLCNLRIYKIFFIFIIHRINININIVFSYEQKHIDSWNLTFQSLNIPRSLQNAK